MDAVNVSDRIAATLYSLGTWFVSGICVLIPCIKEIVGIIIIIIIIINTEVHVVSRMLNLLVRGITTGICKVKVNQSHCRP
jgi:hypothetical protein